LEIRLPKKTVYIPLNGLNVSRRMEFSILRRYLGLTGRERILDVACGDGYWTSRFARQAKFAAGYDYNMKRLQQAARLYADIQGLACSDAHFLPFADGAFDAIVGVCVLEHFQDDLKALRELRRVSKRGARLALTVDSFSLPGITAQEKARHAETYNVHHWYRSADLTRVLDEAGYRVLEHRYLLKAPLSAALYRLAQKTPHFAYALFPVSYPLSLLADRMQKADENGFKLAVLAQAI
jgi:ubiquinone/menaquinone biosynthesis C-methylase UbiE